MLHKVPEAMNVPRRSKTRMMPGRPPPPPRPRRHQNDLVAAVEARTNNQVPLKEVELREITVTSLLNLQRKRRELIPLRQLHKDKVTLEDG
jgi:hypothetical protein